MDNTSFDWSTFSIRINIAADLEKIFDSWTSQEQIEKWFLAKAEYSNSNGTLKPSNQKIEVGDTYKWEWHSSDYVAEGEVLNIDASKSLSFSFLGCKVLVSFYKEADESIIEIVQSAIPTDEATIASHHVGCTRGWTFYLANLKSILEGGIDLRNKNDKIKRVINT